MFGTTAVCVSRGQVARGAVQATICKLVAVVFLVAMGSGCAGVYTDAVISEVKPVAVAPAQVSIVIKDKTTDRMTPEQSGGLKDVITASLQSHGIKVVPADNKAAPCLVGSISNYSPGNSSLNVWVGYGAGVGSIDSAWDLTDQRGTSLGSCLINGTTGRGMASSDFNTVIQKLGDRLAQFLKGVT